MPVERYEDLPDGFNLVRSPDTGRRRCRYCDDPFDAHDLRQEFCGSKCRRAWQSFWMAKGPALARALHEYRVVRSDGSLGALCAEFANALDDFKRKRWREKNGR